VDLPQYDRQPELRPARPWGTLSVSCALPPFNVINPWNGYPGRDHDRHRGYGQPPTHGRTRRPTAPIANQPIRPAFGNFAAARRMRVQADPLVSVG
jgi:hypothetical protein